MWDILFEWIRKGIKIELRINKQKKNPHCVALLIKLIKQSTVNKDFRLMPPKSNT